MAKIKFLDLQVKPCDHPILGEGLEFTFDGKHYFIKSWHSEPLKTVRMSPTLGVYVCDAKRDFGGCGRNAVKVESGVPFKGWLAEAFAVELYRA